MRILITGAAGFIGKNLTFTLKEMPSVELLTWTRDTDPLQLKEFCQKADFVFHLAGVNRPEDPADYYTGNVALTRTLLDHLQSSGNPCPVLLASSVHAAESSPYGISKREAEELVFAHGRQTGAKVLVYRLPNLFGKWSRPHYNSVAATFCYEIARGNAVQVADGDRELTLAYIDDVMTEFLAALRGQEHREGPFCVIPVTHRVTVGRIAALLRNFQEKPQWIPEMGPSSFEKKLYSTYVSYLPEDGVCRPLASHTDTRGSFTELIKTESCGQISVNIIKPGITKGGHWHHSKWEQFTVISGQGRIEMRALGSDKVQAFDVSGAQLQTLRILPGYAHSITNLSNTEDLAVLIWANEPYDPDTPDTFPERVK